LWIGGDAQVHDLFWRIGVFWGFMGEKAFEAGAEAVFEEGVFGVVFVEAPLDSGEAISNATNDLGGLGDCFLKGYWDLEFELDAVAEAVVEVEVGDLVGAGGWIAFADEAEVDLKVLIAGGFRVVGAERRAALGMGQKGREEQGGEDESSGGERHLWPF